MLEYTLRVPKATVDGAPVLVLLHGRGADRTDLLGLAPRLPKDWILVAPQAPFPASPWGYGTGWAWYRFLGHNRPEPETFELSLDRLAGFLGGLDDILPVRHGLLVLGGFSQGGTLSLGYALASAAGRLVDTDAPLADRIVNLSGFLADHPAVSEGLQHGQGIHVFWGHGSRDANIPFALAAEGRAALTAAGVRVDAFDYAIGHWIDASELVDLNAWLAKAASAEGARVRRSGARQAG
jgi:phospholipase/carboxylesterase